MSNARGNSSRVGVSITLGEYAFGDSMITDFSMSIGMNSLPRGSATISGVPNDLAIGSGIYGIIILNDPSSERPMTAFPVYINSMEESMNGGIKQIDFVWEHGTPDSMSNKTMAVTGDSAYAITSLMTSLGYKVVDMVSGSRSGSGVDNMTWRFVNATFDECITDVVNHSCLPGDYMYWSFDETSGSFIISSLNIAKKMSPKHAARWSASSLGNVKYYDEEAGTTLWLYTSDRKKDSRGAARDAIFPNILFNTVDGGEASVTTCTGDDFGKIAESLGGMSDNVANILYSSTEGQNYGSLDLVYDFPMNTHRMYPIAQQLRARTFSEYTKVMTLRINNVFGPPVGTRIAVRAMPTSSNVKIDTMPDTVYSDVYIVAGKAITKTSTTSRGLLGISDSNETPDIVATLTLISNTIDGTGYDEAIELSDKLSVVYAKKAGMTNE